MHFNKTQFLIDPFICFRFKMGGHFGELAKVNGIVIHKISPFEQRAFAGVISKGVPNTFRRCRAQAFRVVPRKLMITGNYRQKLINVSYLSAFILGYVAYSYVESLHNAYLRKNPADFANDE